MRITKIEITNYKSIKEPVEINFYNGLPTVLIGKNGSGKTNILEALSAVAEANGNYFGMRKELPLKYKVHIRLEKEDVERLFPGKGFLTKLFEAMYDELPSRKRKNNGIGGITDELYSDHKRKY